MLLKPHPILIAIGACVILFGVVTAPRLQPATDYVVRPVELVPAPEPVQATPSPVPFVVPTPGRLNRAAVQIQGHDITKTNLGAVPDTNPSSGTWMLSFAWNQTTPIAASEARSRLGELWKRLTPEQQHRRDVAYYSAINWIDESLRHSPPGRRAGEHFAFRNAPGSRGGVPTARVDVAVYEGVAFDIP
jgi:hypothetical protein